MARRQIAFYAPRIQIPVADMFTNPDEYAFYCLPVDGAQALLRIASYLKREVTFVDETLTEKVFLGPDESDLQLIRDIADECEVGLMSGCDLSTIETILAAIQECVCAMSANQTGGTANLPSVDPYVDEGTVTAKSPAGALADYDPPVIDVARCQMSQSIYWWWYTTITEDIWPVITGTIDALTAAIVATSTFAGLASFVGIPIAVLADIAMVGFNVVTDASIEDLNTWLIASRDELICAYYEGLPNLDAARANVIEFIDGEIGLSFLEKVMFKAWFGSTWHMGFIMEDQQTFGTWNTYLSSTACDTCDDPTSFFYTGSPCATATLLGSCGPNDCLRVNVGGDVETPAFTPPEAGDYEIRARLNGSITAGTGEMLFWQNLPSLVVDSKQFSIAPGDDFEFVYVVAATVREYHVEFTNVGAVDYDVQWVSVRKIS